MPYDHERDVALAAALQAAHAIRRHAGQLSARDVETKALHDLVTVADREAQEIVLGALARAFPDDALLGEEDADLARVDRSGRLWIVDPLDGTTNFLHGVPPYAVSIALHEAGRPVVAVVLEVTGLDAFCATRGGGLRLNGKRVGVSTTQTLDRSLIATGFPFRDYRWAEGYLAAFDTVMRSTRGIRRHGSAAMDLAWTAAGRFDGFFEVGLAPWDVAAGVLLVEEGGGRVAALPDGADATFDGGLIATNGHLHPDLRVALEPLARAYAGVVGSADSV
jgi:myo-inositol-1(or 4)-monophosphatase